MTADPVPEPRDPRYLLLAEMFHQLPPEAHDRMMSVHGEPTDSSYQELVAYAAATPAGARLLALAAVGLAVERLRAVGPPDLDEDYPGYAASPDYYVGYDSGWAAAVEAALGERTEGGQR